jgi:TP901 family phage tail tape measure protein
MATLAPVKIPLLGVDKYSKSFNKMTRKIQKIGRATQAAGRKLTTSLTLPIVGFGVLSARTAMDFDDAMRRVQAKTGATGDAMDKLRDKAKELGRTTRYRATEAADAMDKLAMAGWKNKEIFQGVGNVLSLAAASGSDMAQSADVLSNVMGAFNIKAKDSAAIADIVATTLTSSNVDLDTYADSMRYASSVSEAFGMTLADTSAAIGFLGNVGIKGSQAGTALRRMMIQLATGTGSTSTAMKELGINVADSEGNMRRFADILGDMAGSYKGMSQQEVLKSLEDVFGSRAIAGAAAMAKDLSGTGGKLKELVDGINSIRPGKARAMAAIMEGGAGGAWRKTISAFESMQLAFADSGLMDDFAKSLSSIAKSFVEFAKTDPQTLKNIAKALAALAILGPVLTVLGSLTTVIGGVVGLIGGAGGLGTVLAALAGPVGLAIAAVAGLISLVVIFWDDIKGVVKTIKDKVLYYFDFMSKVFELSKVALLHLIEQFPILKTVLSTAVEWIKKIGDGFVWVWDKIKSAYDFLKGKSDEHAENEKKNKKSVLDSLDGMIAGYRRATDKLKGIKKEQSNIAKYGDGGGLNMSSDMNATYQFEQSTDAAVVAAIKEGRDKKVKMSIQFEGLPDGVKAVVAGSSGADMSSSGGGSIMEGAF